MGTTLAETFADLAFIMGVCPCCGELFYLSEARPYLHGKRPASDVDRLRAAEQRLDRADERLDEIEDDLRRAAASAGLRTAKKLLKKIDPTFSGAGYDPQDVKVIFNPVTYVVFNGMAKSNVAEILLLAKPAEDRATEKVHKSIDATIRKGNIEFKTLHVDHEGKVVSR